MNTTADNNETVKY